MVEQPGKPSVGPGQVALLQHILDGGDPALGRELESFRSSDLRLSTPAVQDFVTSVTEGIRSGCSFRKCFTIFLFSILFCLLEPAFCSGVIGGLDDDPTSPGFSVPGSPPKRPSGKGRKRPSSVCGAGERTFDARAFFQNLDLN